MVVSRRAAAGRSTAGRGAVTALLVVLIAVVMLLLVRARPGTEPFDPRSGRADGTRGLVLLLESQGAAVTITRSAPPAGFTGRVLVLDDRLDGDQRAGLLDWVGAGGVLVVADPSSTLHGGPGLDGGSVAVRGDVPPAVLGPDLDAEIDVPRGTCTIAALAHLRGLFVRDGISFALAADDTRCFGSGTRAMVFARPLGAGVVVAVGDNHLFTNALLRYADNGGLATALLAPARGTEVRILLGSGASRSPADVGTGDRRLTDLVRPGVWMGLVQLGAAFVVFALGRALRPGRPVDEPLPVALAAGELVEATGNLMQRARHHERAGWLIRGQLYRDLCARHGLRSTTSVAELDAHVAAAHPLGPGSGVAPGEVAAVLGSETADAAALLALSRRAHELRGRALEAAPVLSPEPTGPDMTEPDMTEPDMTEPDMNEPDMNEPDMNEPDMNGAPR